MPPRVWSSRSRSSVPHHGADGAVSQFRRPGRGRSPARHGDEIYDDFKPIDEQMSDAERRRLLYVACTIDHLVVSLHRAPPKPDVAANRMPSATLLASAGQCRQRPAPTSWLPIRAASAIPRLAPEELEWSDVAYGR